MLVSLARSQEADRSDAESVGKDGVAVEDYTDLEEAVRSDGAADIFDSEPEGGASDGPKTKVDPKDFQKKMDEFSGFQDFFCMMGLQKFITLNNDRLAPILKSSSKQRLQKLAATLFGKCTQDVFSEGMLEAMLKFKSKDDVDKVDYPFIKDFDLEGFLAQTDFSLTKENEKVLKRFNQAQKRMEKLAKKRTRGTPEADDDDDKDDDEEKPDQGKESRASGKKTPRTATRYSSWLYVFVFGVVISLMVLLSWSVLASEKSSQTQKKKKKGN